MQRRVLKRWKISNICAEEPKKTWKGRKCLKEISDVTVIRDQCWDGSMASWGYDRGLGPLCPPQLGSLSESFLFLLFPRLHQTGINIFLLETVSTESFGRSNWCYKGQGDPFSQARAFLFFSSTRNTARPWSCPQMFAEMEKMQAMQ